MTTCPNLTPDTRLVVAGGGGGAGFDSAAGGQGGDRTVSGAGAGGAGCDPSACAGPGHNGGFGPPPGAGGPGTTSFPYPGGPGTLGQGGSAPDFPDGIDFGGGGGGGYDGGGAGGDGDFAGGGGGAGSSFWVLGAGDASMSEDTTGVPKITITPGPAAGGSQVHAVIQVETSPSYAGDPVDISSSQIQSACGGTITFETLQGGSTTTPRLSIDSITVVLDDDGNVTVVVDGPDCAPGTDLVEADLTVAPYVTATTLLDIEPPQVTPAGVSAYPSTEVDTGNSPASGESDVYTVFYVETSPVFAEQPVTISSPELEARCGEGWRWEPASGPAIDQTSGPTVGSGVLDDDGNATFVFKGASCAAGPSAVIADVLAGTHPTYIMTYTIAAPQATFASTVKATTRHHRHHHGGRSGTPAPSPPAMTVSASPGSLVETGSPGPAGAS